MGYPGNVDRLLFLLQKGENREKITRGELIVAERWLKEWRTRSQPRMKLPPGPPPKSSKPHVSKHTCLRLSSRTRALLRRTRPAVAVRTPGAGTALEVLAAGNFKSTSSYS